ncbi:MAG TPA: hypothetical protein VMP67_11955 [Candidatus Limnocylindria bacterium]|nr:hypothetical protein [Candidatus Limnocylindria bacterium]
MVLPPGPAHDRWPWIDERRQLVSRRAYARWVLARVAGLAAAAGEPQAMGGLWQKARQHGRAGIVDVAQFLVYRLVAALRARRGSRR